MERTADRDFDVVVVGCGVAGLSAATISRDIAKWAKLIRDSDIKAD